MALRKKKSESTCDALAVPQTAGKSHPFLSLSSYSPSHGDMELYKSLREAIPVIDAAIYKLIRLLGSFRVNCTDERAEEELENFLGSVNVGGTRRGIDVFSALSWAVGSLQQRETPYPSSYPGQKPLWNAKTRVANTSPIFNPSPTPMGRSKSWKKCTGRPLRPIISWD